VLGDCVTLANIADVQFRVMIRESEMCLQDPLVLRDLVFSLFSRLTQTRKICQRLTRGDYVYLLLCICSWNSVGSLLVLRSV